jgi:hypothetical protein
VTKRGRYNVQNLMRGRAPPAWLPSGGMSRVLKLHADGLDAATLAERFGTTKNAVHGKLWRARKAAVQ